METISLEELNSLFAVNIIKKVPELRGIFEIACAKLCLNWFESLSYNDKLERIRLFGIKTIFQFSDKELYLYLINRYSTWIESEANQQILYDLKIEVMNYVSITEMQDYINFAYGY